MIEPRTAKWCCAVAVVLMTMGCNGSDGEPRLEQKKEAKNMIEPNQVRAALVELIQKTADNPALQREMDVVKNSPVTPVEDSTFRIGKWYCNQKDLTFVVTFHDLPFMLEYSGKFEADSQGKWKATITGKKQTPAK